MLMLMLSFERAFSVYAIDSFFFLFLAMLFAVDMPAHFSRVIARGCRRPTILRPPHRPPTSIRRRRHIDYRRLPPPSPSPTHIDAAHFSIDYRHRLISFRRLMRVDDADDSALLICCHCFR